MIGSIGAHSVAGGTSQPQFEGEAEMARPQPPHTLNSRALPDLGVRLVSIVTSKIPLYVIAKPGRVINRARLQRINAMDQGRQTVQSSIHALNHLACLIIIPAASTNPEAGNHNRCRMEGEYGPSSSVHIVLLPPRPAAGGMERRDRAPGERAILAIPF